MVRIEDVRKRDRLHAQFAIQLSSSLVSAQNLSTLLSLAHFHIQSNNYITRTFKLYQDENSTLIIQYSIQFPLFSIF